MELGDAAHDRKTQAASASSRIGPAPEPLQHFDMLPVRNSGAGILDRHQVEQTFAGHRHRTAAAGIVDEIANQYPETDFVAGVTISVSPET